MKAQIKPSGTMVIRAQSELEAYALRIWGEVHKDKLTDIILDHSFPGPEPWPFLNDREFEILVNCLGAPSMHRNYFAAGPKDVSICEGLVNAGLMEQNRVVHEANESEAIRRPIFSVTPWGREVVLTEYKPNP